MKLSTFILAENVAEQTSIYLRKLQNKLQARLHPDCKEDNFERVDVKYLVYFNILKLQINQTSNKT